MVVQDDTVYITGLPPEATAENVGELFGSIGVIKVLFLPVFMAVIKVADSQ